MSGAPFVTFNIYGLNDEPATIRLIQGPENLVDRAHPARLPNPIERLSSASWTVSDSVRSYGEALLRCLNNVADQSIKDAIDHVVNGDGTIYFKLNAADWDSQAWEALWDNTDFFLLRPQRGMARVVDPLNRSLFTWTLEQPVRIMAVLSAAGLKNGPQWEALYRAARDNARADQGLPLHLHVLTGEERLADSIRNDAPKGERLTVTVENIDVGRSRKVSSEIKSFRPHVLHFFCHGQVVQGAGVLRLSDIEQHRESLINPQPPDGVATSFPMDYSEFREILERARAQGWLWLVVLNACKLGTPTPNVFALAQKFAIAGVPAAIGMTEEIDESDASEFCRAFYSSLLLELANANSALETAEEYVLEWAKLLHEPRKSIRDRRGSASCNPQWTFPILYVGGFDFKLKKARRVPAKISDFADFLRRFRLIGEQITHTETSDLADAIREGALQQLQNAPEIVRETFSKVEVK